jgi:hypothetical protein
LKKKKKKKKKLRKTKKDTATVGRRTNDLESFLDLSLLHEQVRVVVHQQQSLSAVARMLEEAQISCPCFLRHTEFPLINTPSNEKEATSTGNKTNKRQKIRVIVKNKTETSEILVGLIIN